MKKGSLNFMISLILAVIFVFGMFSFSSSLLSFFKKTDYNSDADRLYSLLTSDVESNFPIIFPSKSSKTIALGSSTTCEGLSEAKDKGLLVEGKKFYFCFYDSKDNTKYSCRGIDRTIKIVYGTKKEDTDFNSKSCFVVPDSYPSSYSFSFNPEGFTLTISKTSG